MDTACGLFREVAREVAHRLGFAYPQGDDDRMTDYLRAELRPVVREDK